MNPLEMMLNMLLQQRPDLQNNPNAIEMINIIRSGDSQRGEEIANNICKSYGMTREQAMGQAQQMFMPRPMQPMMRR